MATMTELNRLKAEAPQQLEHTLDMPGGHVVSVLIFGFAGTVPVASGFGLKPSSARSTYFQIDPVRLSCPGDCPAGIFTFFLGHRDPINRFRNDPSNRLSMPPEETAKFLVELEVKDCPYDVGLPVDVLRIDNTGATWLPPRAGRPEPIPRLKDGKSR